MAVIVALACLAPDPGPAVAADPPGEAGPRFANYTPRPPLGRSAGEPSLAANWNSARTMYISGLETLRVTWDTCTSPATDLWEDVSPPTTPPTTLDPILWTDPVTGRTFSSQLAGKTSVMSFTDDDGVNWTQSQGAGINSGVDHQTVGGGRFPADDPIGPTGDYPHAVYYCSQDVVTAQCALSRDGGLTFGPAVPIYTAVECNGLHGQVQVAPDGTVYVPNNTCDREAVILDSDPGFAMSEDAGLTWSVRTVPNRGSNGSSDPAIGIGENGTLYYGFEDEGRAMMALSRDKGLNWTDIQDVGAPLGVRHSVFPQVVGGDDDRAAYAFLGSTYDGPGDVEGEDPTLPVVWHLYIAMTFDGGRTWVTSNVTPGDPVQRGTICGAGPTCASSRNLLDFNDITVDEEGRVLAAYADGCIGGCVNGPPNSGTDVAKIARQISGRRLFAAFDPDGTRPPAAVLLQAFFGPGRNELEWEEPDDRGAAIVSYRVYRRTASTPRALLAALPAGSVSYDDAAIVEGETYFYEVTAVNANGEGDLCREVTPIVRPVVNPCEAPGVLVAEDPEGDTPFPNLDVRSLSIAEPFFADFSDKLVFTLKVTDLGVITTGNAWVILWNRPIPDASFDRNFVAMRAVAPGVVAFRYGKVTPPSVNQGIDMGDADAGSFTPDGTITITIAADKIDGVAGGQDLNGIEVRTFLSNVSGQPVSQLSSNDLSAPGFYTRAGNLACNPAPFARDDAAATPEGVPVTINVLANDTDADGDPMTVVTLTQPANGSVANNHDGTVTYAPVAGFVGVDGFAYTVSDPGGLTGSAGVTVTVFRSAPFQNSLLENDFPDTLPGIDEDGNYRISWTYPKAPQTQPCAFRIDEATDDAPIFSDDAEELLVAGANSRWSGDPNWISGPHPDTGTLGYTFAYTDEILITLTMTEPVGIPAATRAQLVFDSFEDIEDDFDYAFVDVSADGGPFQVMFSSTGGFSGRRVIDLSSFAGRSVRVRFRFDSDMLVSAPLFLGWFVDNIAIEVSEFMAIATVDGGLRRFDVLGRSDGTYLYRVAGLFGAGCDTLSPFSNLREMTVDLQGGPGTVGPAAEFSAAPNPAEVGQTVTFDASASHDNDDVGPQPAIARYFWTFGDGATADTTDPATTHAYAATGAYRVALTVTDNEGQTDSTEHLVEVTETTTPDTTLKVTGGGWITAGGGAADFAFNAVEQVGMPISGHLDYNDKASRVKVHSGDVTSLSISGSRATFGGSCTVNKVPGFTFTVEVVDNAKSGSGDTFVIRLSNGYEAGGRLGGGNIKVVTK